MAAPTGSHAKARWYRCQNSAAGSAYLPLLVTRRFSCLGAGGFSLEPWGFLTLASSGLPLSLSCAAVDCKTLECLYEKARVVKYSTKWRVEWVSLLGVINCRLDLYSSMWSVSTRRDWLHAGFFFFMLSTPAVERSFSVDTTDVSSYLLDRRCHFFKILPLSYIKFMNFVSHFKDCFLIHVFW